MKILIVLALAVTSIITAHTGEMPGMSQAMANTKSQASQMDNRSSAQSSTQSVSSVGKASIDVGGGSELAPDYTMTCSQVEDTLFCSTSVTRLKTESYLRNAAGMDQYAQQVMKKGLHSNGNLVEGDHLLRVTLQDDGSFKRIHYSIVGISAQAYAKSRGCAELIGLKQQGLRKLEIRCKNPISSSGQVSSGASSVNTIGGTSIGVNQGYSVARASIQRVSN